MNVIEARDELNKLIENGKSKVPIMIVVDEDIAYEVTKLKKMFYSPWNVKSEELLTVDEIKKRKEAIVFDIEE